MTNDFAPTAFEPYRGVYARQLAEGDYDPVKFKLFRDTLDAMSIGAGTQALPLEIVSMPLPIAYIAPYTKGLIHLKKVIEDLTDFAIVVTAGLLDSDMNRSEVEAMMADLLAKAIIPGAQAEITWEEITRWIAPETREAIKRRFGQDSAVIHILNQDGWSAHLINQPGALESAILKSMKLLEGYRIKAKFPLPGAFVEPQHANRYGFVTRIMFNRFFASAQKIPDNDPTPAIYRDLVLEMRIEGLKELDAHPSAE